MKMQNKWWDGYQDEENVLLDDFDMKELGHHLKIWADRYSFLAELKGSARHIRPRRFIVTSNYHPRDLFGHDAVLLEAILRRFELREMLSPFVVPATAPLDDDVLLSVVGSDVLPAPPSVSPATPASLGLLDAVHDVSDNEVLPELQGRPETVLPLVRRPFESDYFMSRVTAPRRALPRPRPPAPLPPGQRTLL